jgi:hypothetical protein
MRPTLPNEARNRPSGNSKLVNLINIKITCLGTARQVDAPERQRPTTSATLTQVIQPQTDRLPILRLSTVRPPTTTNFINSGAYLPDIGSREDRIYRPLTFSPPPPLPSNVPANVRPPTSSNVRPSTTSNVRPTNVQPPAQPFVPLHDHHARILNQAPGNYQNCPKYIYTQLF